jgi:hypothetical protein
MKQLFNSTVSALCHVLVRNGFARDVGISSPSACNAAARFAVAQHAGMPDFLRGPLFFLTILFGIQAFIKSGRFFHLQSPEARWAHVLAWKSSRLGVRRDLIRFYESLTVLVWSSRKSTVR